MDKLKQLQNNIDRLIAKKAKLVQSKAIPDIIGRMRAAGVTPKDIADAWGPVSADTARRGPRKSTVKGTKPTRTAKYRHPDTGATWSGLGKRPTWIHEALSAGHKLEDFLIVG